MTGDIPALPGFQKRCKRKFKKINGSSGPQNWDN